MGGEEGSPNTRMGLKVFGVLQGVGEKLECLATCVPGEGSLSHCNGSLKGCR